MDFYNQLSESEMETFNSEGLEESDDDYAIDSNQHEVVTAKENSENCTCTIISVALKKMKLFGNPFLQYDTKEFKKRYMFSKQSVLNVLLPLVKDDLMKFSERGRPIPPMIQLLATLRFYLTGNFKLIGAENPEISQPTLSRVVKRVSNYLSLKKNSLIRFPDALSTIKEKFQSISQLPNVIGAIGGSHISVAKPGSAHCQAHKNQMGFHSIYVQVVCGPDTEILNIEVAPGSNDANTIFESSELRFKLEQGNLDGVLLGNSEYNGQIYVLTSLSYPANDTREAFEVGHFQTINTLERTIESWKKNFPCLNTKLATSLETSYDIIVATALLYNIALECKDIANNEVPMVNCNNTIDNDPLLEDDLFMANE